MTQSSHQSSASDTGFKMQSYFKKQPKFKESESSVNSPPKFKESESSVNSPVSRMSDNEKPPPRMPTDYEVLRRLTRSIIGRGRPCSRQGSSNATTSTDTPSITSSPLTGTQTSPSTPHTTLSGPCTSASRVGESEDEADEVGDEREGDDCEAKKKETPMPLDEVITHTMTNKHNDSILQTARGGIPKELKVTDRQVWYSLVERYNAKNCVPGVGDYECKMRKMNPSSKPRRSRTSYNIAAEIAALKEQNQRLQEQIDNLTSSLPRIQEEIKKLFGGNLPRRGDDDGTGGARQPGVC